MWYHKVVENLENVAACLDFYNQQYTDAKNDVILKGRLEKNSAALPGLVEHRFNQLQEIEAILEFLNIQLKKIRSKIYRKYLESYNRQLSSRDADKFVDGEDEVIQAEELVNEFALLRNRFLGIMKALDNKGFQIHNITKLRTAGLEDTEI